MCKFNSYKLVILLMSCFIVSCNSQTNMAPKIASPNAIENVKSPSNINSGNAMENLPLKTDTPVVSVDFKNFAFPVCPNSTKEIVPKLKSIKLRDGELEIKTGQLGSTEPYLKFSLENVSYSDLTNDDYLDAVVTIGVKYFQGKEHCTFIYSFNDKSPKLLWTYEFSVHEIRKLAFEQGGLLIEQYNNGTAACCPPSYSRSLYNWNGIKFIQTNFETLPNETDSNKFLGFPDN
jgi:hypothetical protein